MECLQKEVATCKNAHKLMNIANESGGACEGNNLNPFFKQHVIDHLETVKGDSPCFTIADDSYKCYEQAGEQIMRSGVDTVDISKFYKVADKFFDIIWDCLIKVFKSNSETCKQWQLPMLLALQKTAMPSLFGMRLNNYQVAKLELGDFTNIPTTTDSPSSKDCEGKSEQYFILLKALLERPQAGPGDLVLQVNSDDNGQPVLTLVGSAAQDNQDISNFVDQVSKKERKEKKKKEKEIKNFIQRIGAAQKKGGKQIKKNQQPKQQPQKKKPTEEGMIS
ncbi:hypothetical protein Btru_053305 [Bulinus truncatus]|nr:hypothetical protein Btru_053305 [Bulinus truncatus]